MTESKEAILNAFGKIGLASILAFILGAVVYFNHQDRTEFHRLMSNSIETQARLLIKIEENQRIYLEQIKISNHLLEDNNK